MRFVSGACGTDCPVGYLTLRTDFGTLTDDQRLALQLANPFGCTDVCCPRPLIEARTAASHGIA